MTAASHPVLVLRDAALVMPQSRSDRERLRQAAIDHFDDVWCFLRSLGVPRGSLDDAVQEVFLVAARKIASVNPGAEKGYLFSVAVHVTREFRRKFSREELADDPDDASLEPASHATPADSFEQQEERRLLLRLLDGLPHDMRVVFVLYEIEGQSLAEIAALLGIPLGTAGTRLRRARAQFETRMQRLQSRLRGET